MALLTNPYSSLHAYSPLYASGRASSSGFFFPGASSTIITKYVLFSKSFEQYIRSAASEIVSFLRSAQDMREAAQRLARQNDSPFLERTVKSSDGGKVTASASAGAAVKTCEVKVDALAVSQKNSGALLSGSDPSVVSAGINAFSITIGGKTTKVSVFVYSDDTNDQALNRIKNAINAAKTGVTASIVTDEETGRKRLELTADKTGTDNAFQVEDVTGNAMSATGVTNVARQAADASYSVDGGPTLVSQSNTIELEKGKVTATLLAVTDEAVSIQVGPDSERIVSRVKDLVSGYNAMYNRLREAESCLSSSVRKSFDAVVQSPDYERLGISRGFDGTLRLDEERLESSLSANFDWTAKTLGGNLGLADRLAKALERYDDMPAISMLNEQARHLQQLVLYQSSLQMFWPMHTSGLIFDLIF